MKKYVVFLFFVVAAQANHEIKKEDREILQPFFEQLIRKGDLGYVLLGEKPAVLLGYVHHLSWRHPFLSLGSLSPYLNHGNQYFKRAWEIWKKYLPQVSDQFLITEEPSIFSPLALKIFIIHRDCFCTVVDENRDLFEMILEREITGETLFEEAKRRPLFSDLLKKNEALLGVILGYGKINATLYSEKKMNCLDLFPKEEDTVNSIALPIFRANWEEDETLQLRKRYLTCRDRIQTMLIEQNALDQVAQILFKD